MKKIWTNYWKEIKEAAKTLYVAVKEILKSTFELFKNTLIAFVYGIYDWLVTLITQLSKVLWDFIKLVCYGLFTAVISTLKYAVEKLISFIKKW